MDRRQKKTREAIFSAFTQLLSQKDYSHITVGEIIEGADIGRATFYAHFETKDFLLKAFCEDLLCHIFDVEARTPYPHNHIFTCEGCYDSVFLHLFFHIQKNDNHIRTLLSSQNNDLFLDYFRKTLYALVEGHLSLFDVGRSKNIPMQYWINHIVSTYIETIKWWIKNGMKESPEEITKYFFNVTRGDSN